MIIASLNVEVSYHIESHGVIEHHRHRRGGKSLDE